MTRKDSREREIIEAFVALATGLGNEEFDIIELLNGLAADCARLLDVDTVGLLTADPRGKLHVLAASTEEARILELFQLQAEEGPCWDCYNAGEPVTLTTGSDLLDRYPTFGRGMKEAGIQAVHAFPMHHNGTRDGALGVFSRTPGDLPEADRFLVQSLVDVTAVTIHQRRGSIAKDREVDQLQVALNSRIVLEQAKGIVAQSARLDVGEAFELLRRYARSNKRRLADVTKDVVCGQLPLRELLSATTRPDR